LSVPLAAAGLLAFWLLVIRGRNGIRQLMEEDY